MKLTAEDYKRHYRELNDDEFLAINRADLVDSARRCYDAELTRRQLAPEPETAAEPIRERPARAAGPHPSQDLATVAVFLSPEDANAARAMLESADMECFLSGEHLATVNRWLSFAGGGQCLMVPATDAEAARDLLQPYITEANKSLVQLWFQEVWMNGREDPTAAAANLRELRAALPDFTLIIEDIFSEADRVAARIAIRGVHPPTNANVEFGGICIVRLAAGSIAETWINLDRLAFLTQTGGIPGE